MDTNSHRHHFGAQIFGEGNIPDNVLYRLTEWGFGEAYWLEVPDAEQYLLDAYALGLMRRLALGDYRWADRETSPRAAVSRLITDFVGQENVGGICFHSSRYVDLLKEAWRLGAGERPEVNRAGWRRSQAVADAFYTVTEGSDSLPDDPTESLDLGRAVATAYSAWGGEPMPGQLLQAVLGARRMTETDWAVASDDLRCQVGEGGAGVLIRLLYFAYDLGHPAAPVPDDAPSTD
jgi:hypothetical protein